MASTEAPDRDRFCGLVAAARSYAVATFYSGSEYCHHPVSVVEDGIVFVNLWHVSNSCWAAVMTEPDAEIIPPYNDSLGNPRGPDSVYPRVRSGELIKVYDGGRWLAEGPWQERINAVLDRIDLAVKNAQAKRLNEQARKDEVNAREREATFERAREALAGDHQ